MVSDISVSKWESTGYNLPNPGGLHLAWPLDNDSERRGQGTVADRYPSLPLSYVKIKTSSSVPACVALLIGLRPANPKVAGWIPLSGNMPDLQLGPGSGRLGRAAYQCFSLFLPSFPSLS